MEVLTEQEEFFTEKEDFFAEREDFIDEKEDYVRRLPTRRRLPIRKLPVIKKKLPSVVQKKISNVVAYRTDKKNPKPVPQQVMVVAKFIPTFITSQNKRETVTLAPPQQLQAFTYAPVEMPMTTTEMPMEQTTEMPLF
jgi:hypothetical protein